METITIHPRTKEEKRLFECLAKALKISYEIKHKASTNNNFTPAISLSFNPLTLHTLY